MCACVCVEVVNKRDIISLALIKNDHFLFEMQIDYSKDACICIWGVLHSAVVGSLNFL